MYNYQAIIKIRKKENIKYNQIINKYQNQRSITRIKESSLIAFFNVRAKDITALRASINSIMRDVKVIEDSISVKFHKKQ